MSVLYITPSQDNIYEIRNQMVEELNEKRKLEGELLHIANEVYYIFASDLLKILTRDLSANMQSVMPEFIQGMLKDPDWSGFVVSCIKYQSELNPDYLVTFEEYLQALQTTSVALQDFNVKLLKQFVSNFHSPDESKDAEGWTEIICKVISVRAIYDMQNA